MAVSPRLVLFPGVGDEPVAELVGEVGVGVVAAAADVDGDVGDEGGGHDVFGPEHVLADALVGVQVVNVQGVRA